MYDAKYSNMSVEQVYADLQKEQQKKGDQAKIDQSASEVAKQRTCDKCSRPQNIRGYTVCACGTI